MRATVKPAATLAASAAITAALYVLPCHSNPTAPAAIYANLPGLSTSVITAFAASSINNRRPELLAHQ